MKQLMLTLGAAASALTLSVAPAMADESPRRSGKVTYSECRKSDGVTGLAAGGVAGALIGGGIFGGLLGPLIGAVGGAFAGRAIDRDSTKAKRCRVVREENTQSYEREQRYETQRYNDQYQNEYAPSQPGWNSNGSIREEDRDLVQPERS